MIELAAACLCAAPVRTAAGQAAAKSVDIPFTDAAPVIDGHLDESVWKSAELVDDFHQTTPTEFAPPTVRTRVYLLYSKDALYIGARLYDPQPVTANTLRQGGRIFSDDNFGVTLDPFNSHRSGYRFMVNPNGVRFDALYKNVSQIQPDWDGIWRAATSVTDDGWVAEIEIPFKTLSFDPMTQVWGINFSRDRASNQETDAWVSRNRQVNPSVSGEAAGLHDLDQGLGLDLVPSLSVVRKRSFNPGHSDVKLDPSLDIYYKLTPALNASLTFNTDFSATEVDNRQVNLTRFSLFFPEKRSFFLRESDIFEFGRLGSLSGRPGTSTLDRASLENGRPFFSRRIGLSADGNPVDLAYGGKISGRIGRTWEVGALAVRQDAYRDVKASKLLVGRVVANVLSESSLGLIVTSGDPRSNLDNQLIGLDFRYLNTRLPGGRTLQGDLWYQASHTQGVSGGQDAFGWRLRSPNSVGLRGSFGMKQLGENFYPALGYVNRSGIRDYTAEFAYTRRLRNRYLREIFSGVDAERVDYLSGGLQSQLITLRLAELQNNTADRLRLRYNLQEEVLREPFEISDGVVIPVGRYRFNDAELQLSTGNQRRLAVSLTARRGEFYDGTRNGGSLEFTWVPSRHLNLSASAEVNSVKLPEGTFVTRLETLNAALILSPTLSWSNLVQYDNVSDSIGINSRMHWIPEAGREAFLVLNYGLIDPQGDGSFQASGADLTLKMNYTLRF